MNKIEKNQEVQELVSQLQAHPYVYIVDTSSMSAGATNDLRRQLFKNDITMRVSKNTLIKLAMQQSGTDYGDLDTVLKGVSALMFTNDMKSPARIIKEIRKKNKMPLLKGAFVENSVYLGDNQLDSLLTLKTKNELIGDIVGLLQSPMNNVLSALKTAPNTIAGLVKALEEKKN